MRTMNIGLMLSAFLLLQGISANAAQEIIVSAATSLTNAMSEIGKSFELENPSIKITFNFAAPGELLQQMIQGAPVDVFISANQKFMDDAQAKQVIIPATRKDFTRNALVLITPAANASVTTLADLLKPEVKRVAIGDPASVPAGQYAKEAFEGEQIWGKLGEKLVFGSNVRQVLDYVRRGEVDAGVVFSTDAELEPESAHVVLTLEHHAPIVYPLAVTAMSQNADAAARFVEFVVGEKGQDILRQFGFQPIE